MKEKDGRLIVILSENPILETCMHEVEYGDRYKTTMAANMIANNLFSKVDQYGQLFVLFYDIVDSRIDSTQIKNPDAFIHMKNGNKRRQDTTKV